MRFLVLDLLSSMRIGVNVEIVARILALCNILSEIKVSLHAELSHDMTKQVALLHGIVHTIDLNIM